MQAERRRMRVAWAMGPLPEGGVIRRSQRKVLSAIGGLRAPVEVDGGAAVALHLGAGRIGQAAAAEEHVNAPSAPSKRNCVPRVSPGATWVRSAVKRSMAGMAWLEDSGRVNPVAAASPVLCSGDRRADGSALGARRARHVHHRMFVASRLRPPVGVWQGTG